MNRRLPRVRSASGGVSRRMFLGAGAAGGAALLAGGWPALLEAAPQKAGGGAWVEATIPQLQAMMATGKLSSRELTQGYLARIASLNPLLHAVIETNPQAVAIASRLDNERRAGRLRGPLHGIPVLLKDNIATADNMQTTAGSLALLNSRVPGDAPFVARLRQAGAVILGKANLGEWANFRGFNPLGSYGWTARGGETHNPYVLDYTAMGSSSGSGVAVAANLCSAAVGTETDGSVTAPANGNLVVGLKPTVGLVSQNGVIPISHEQDTAGPMGRTVTDVATLLSVMQTPFGAVAGQPLPQDYAQFLVRGALSGKRIGVDRRFFDYSYFGYPGDDDSVALVEDALNVMHYLGATLVDVDTGDIFEYYDAEFFALLCEFKVHIAEYLATLEHTNMRTLSDLIAFNLSRCTQELRTYGQELFEIADSTAGLEEPGYADAREWARTRAREGIDNALAAANVDAIVAPHLTNTTAPAVWLSQPGASGRCTSGWQARRALDVRRLPQRAVADRLRVRSRAGDERAKSADDAWRRQRSARRRPVRAAPRAPHVQGQGRLGARQALRAQGKADLVTAEVGRSSRFLPVTMTDS